MCPGVYVLVSGETLEDQKRLMLKGDMISLMEDHGVHEMVDADAGLLPMDRWSPPSADELVRDRRTHSKDSVNLFTVGELAETENFGIRELESSMIGLVENMDERIYFVVFVIVSPLHRSFHRDHICIPSQFMIHTYRDNKVFVESWLVNKDTGELEIQGEEQHGRLFVFDDEENNETELVDRGVWETLPEIRYIPDGQDGVGGRTLIRSFALERAGYRGGALPEKIRKISPEVMGLVEEDSEDSLPVMVRSKMITVRYAKGGRNESGLMVDLLLENNTNQQVTVKVPKGYLFEVIDPKAAVQNLVTQGETRVTMNANSTMSLTLQTLCANHRFASPRNHPMRPTIYRMENPKSTQNEVWRDLDSRGYKT